MKQFIYPYFMFKDAKESAMYYKKVFKGEIAYIMLGKDMPNCPQEQLESVMHLQFNFNGNTLYMADDVVSKGDHIQIHLDYENKSELISVFEAFKPESTVIEDLEEKFWGALMGTLKDKYGVTWQFHYVLPTPDESTVKEVSN